ncbi:2326_t:CDS:2, partial [Funneliformis geosporum]
GIHSDIEELLTREVNRYYRKRDRQKIKIEANTSTDGTITFSRLDGFEKQLEGHEYDALKSRLESKYNNCMVDMKQKTYSFKHHLESQHNSKSTDLERQYKSQITTLEKSIVIKDKENGKLSSTISQLKNDKKDIKKSAERKCKELEDVIFAKDLKIIALNDKIISYNPHVGKDATIEPSLYFNHHETKLWTGKRKDAKNDLNIRKKYTFQMRV